MAKYETKLSKDEEKEFVEWMQASKEQGIIHPDDNGDDYDFRGFWKDIVKNNCIITDIGSTKGTILDELRSIVEKIDRVHSVEEYSTILCTLTRIKRDVLSKRIKSEEIDSLLKEIQKKMPLAGMKSEIFYGMEEQKGIAI